MPCLSTNRNTVLNIEIGFAEATTTPVIFIMEGSSQIGTIPIPLGFGNDSNTAYHLEVQRLKYSDRCVLAITDGYGFWTVDSTVEATAQADWIVSFSPATGS